MLLQQAGAVGGLALAQVQLQAAGADAGADGLAAWAWHGDQSTPVRVSAQPTGRPASNTEA
jgi:hypothetical protein